MATGVDFSARYSVRGYRGVAFYVKRYATCSRWVDVELVCDEEECGHEFDWCWIGGTYEEAEDLDSVVAVMVGDDREHVVPVIDLTRLEEDDYCHECGQVGCAHDGRARDE